MSGTFDHEVSKQERRRLRAYERFAKETAAARKRLDGTLEDVAEKLQELSRYEEDLPVLVRTTPGPQVQVYHLDQGVDGGFTCQLVTGSGRDPQRFRRRLEGRSHRTYAAAPAACGQGAEAGLGGFESGNRAPKAPTPAPPPQVGHYPPLGALEGDTEWHGHPGS